METKTERGIEVVSMLSECLQAIGNPARFRIVEYCATPRRFTDIILDLRLNPASFKFHLGVLSNYELIEKVERGVYQTTELGKTLMKLVETASQMID